MTDTEEWARARDRDIEDQMLREQHEAMTYPYGKPEARFRTGANKPVVALDIDGTLGDYHRHFLDFAAGWFGRPMPDPEEARHGTRLSTFIGVSHREYRDCKLAYRQGGMKRTMPCYPFASELTTNIRAAGAQVWLCTTRPYMRLDNVDPDTREWLRRNDIEYDAVIFEGIDEESKYEDLVDQVGLARIIAVCDDLPAQVADAQRLGIGTCYLRDQPYNRDVNGLPGFRVKSLEELWQAVEVNIGLWRERR
jgi:hypothetical protein